MITTATAGFRWLDAALPACAVQFRVIYKHPLGW
jgi:hypothetical protein